MLTSVAFTPVLVAILGVAELVCSVGRNILDWLVWPARSPSYSIVLYVPTVRRFEAWTVLPACGV